MPFTFGLGGSKEKEQSQSIGTKGSTTFGTRGGTQSSSDLSSVEEFLNSITSGSVVRGTDQSRELINQAVEGLVALFDSYSPEQADISSKDSVTAAIDEVLNRDLPGVRTADTVAGGYNSTATRLLRDNIVAQASSAGARVREETRARFEQNRQQLVGNFLDIITRIQEGNVQTIQEEDASSKGTESGTTFAETAEEYGESVDETIIGKSGGTSSGRSFELGFNSGE